MTTKQNSARVTTLVSGLIVGGVALASLATTGCDESSTQQVASSISGSHQDIAGQRVANEKLESCSRLAGNHNETFLISAIA